MGKEGDELMLIATSWPSLKKIILISWKQSLWDAWYWEIAWGWKVHNCGWYRFGFQTQLNYPLIATSMSRVCTFMSASFLLKRMWSCLCYLCFVHVIEASLYPPDKMLFVLVNDRVMLYWGVSFHRQSWIPVGSKNPYVQKLGTDGPVNYSVWSLFLLADNFILR